MSFLQCWICARGPLSPTSVASSHYLNVCGARCTVASCVTTGVTPAAPLHSGKSRLSLHLCSCRAARLGSGAPALPVSRVLAGLRLVDPPWISCSVGERAPHRYLRLSTKPAAGTGSCVKPQRRGRGVDSRDLDPALGNLQWPCASL